MRTRDLRTIKTCSAFSNKPAVNRGDRLAVVKPLMWQQGEAIRIDFLDGDSTLRQRVQKAAEAWLEHANLKLYFGAGERAQVRISFMYQGSWSWIGTACRNVKAPEPTMNFGWLTRHSPEEELFGVVVHEFGHALGCLHEHQSPAAGIKWNKELVYRYYQGPPNNWDEQQVDVNLFDQYDKTLTFHSEFDPESIMIYPVPREFTLDGFEVGWRSKLSRLDKEFMRKTYPF